MFLKKVVTFLNERPVTTLLIFFAISVVVRIPNLNRPLSKHHELNAALVLINAEAWNKTSPSFYHYVPVHSYHQPGDDVDPYTDSLTHGYHVNVSFGSLWYVMPYAFFKLLHAPPSPLLLQVFNLLLHLLTLLLIYHIALYLFSEEVNPKVKAVTTSVIYLFSPGPLWFHGNEYVHEIAVLPFIYASIVIYLNYIHKPSLARKIFLPVVIAAGICCDWLMCFVAAAMFIHSLYSYMKKKEVSYLTSAALLTTGVIAGLSITIIQFSSFMGFSIYFKALLSRFLTRGLTGSSEAGGLSKGVGLGSFYLLGYGILIPFIIFIAVVSKSFKQRLKADKSLRTFLIIAACICLVHHLLFWGFTNIHDYSVVKSGLVVSLLATVALFTVNGRTRRVAALATILIINTGIYYYINRPGRFAANGQPYAYFKNLGEEIKAIAAPGDYIFTDVPEFSLLLTYYSKRFYRRVKNVNEADSLFKTLPGKNAVFVHTNNFEFVNYARLRK